MSLLCIFLKIYVTSFVLGTNIYLGAHLNLIINVNFSVILDTENEPEAYWLGSTRPLDRLQLSLNFLGSFINFNSVAWLRKRNIPTER
jgi:hypothetical protein